MLGKLHLYIPIQRHLKAFFLIMYGLIISRTQQKIKQFFANLRKICLIFELFKWCWIICGEFRVKSRSRCSLIDCFSSCWFRITLKTVCIPNNI